MNHINEDCNSYDHINALYYQNKYNITLGYLTILFILNLFQYFIYILYFQRYTYLSNQITHLLHNIKAKYHIFKDEDIQMLDIHKLHKSLNNDLSIYQKDWCLTNEPIPNSFTHNS